MNQSKNPNFLVYVNFIVFFLFTSSTFTPSNALTPSSDCLNYNAFLNGDLTAFEIFTDTIYENGKTYFNEATANTLDLESNIHLLLGLEQDISVFGEQLSLSLVAFV